MSQAVTYVGSTSAAPPTSSLLTILQSLALMVLQQPVLAAEMSGAEAAVTNDGLRSILAVLEVALDLLWGATT